MCVQRGWPSTPRDWSFWAQGWNSVEVRECTKHCLLGALFSAAEETFPGNQEGKTRKGYILILTWTDASQNRCFPGIWAPRCFPFLQLGDQNRFGQWKCYSSKRKRQTVEGDIQRAS